MLYNTQQHINDIIAKIAITAPAERLPAEQFGEVAYELIEIANQIGVE